MLFNVVTLVSTLKCIFLMDSYDSICHQLERLLWPLCCFSNGQTPDNAIITVLPAMQPKGVIKPLLY